MRVEGRDPDPDQVREVARAAEIDAMRLDTPKFKVRKLQNSLQAKAKAEPNYRFYSLWDKICREDVLSVAYRLCRRKGGAPGADGERFADIEAQGVEQWLGKLREELRNKEYVPQPLLRVWIAKSNGGQRPLSIPTIRERTVQTAVLLVIGSIFEVDLLDEQYGFRRGKDAKEAVRSVYFDITQRGRSEVVDGDLSDYFSSIPHCPLLRCVARRIADGQVLSVVRQWLRVPVVEKDKRGRVRRTTQAKDTSRGTAQGSVVSPLLANLYFRRFLLAWKQFGIQERLKAHVVNYADDFVICCKPGNGEAAMIAMRQLMTRLGLTVNERKTHLVALPRESFDFLGYTIGRYYRRDGSPYVGTRPSRKAVSRLIRRVHDQTSARWYTTPVESRVAQLNPLIRGWAAYFNQGPVSESYWYVQAHTERRLRRWLMKKHGRQGTGYRQYPDGYLYETLGLYNLTASLSGLPSAKA